MSAEVCSTSPAALDLFCRAWICISIFVMFNKYVFYHPFCAVCDPQAGFKVQVKLYFERISGQIPGPSCEEITALS